MIRIILFYPLPPPVQVSSFKTGCLTGTCSMLVSVQVISLTVAYIPQSEFSVT